MKSLPRAILCTIGLLFICFLFIFTNPINREVGVVGWEFNTTRNTSQYILRNNLTAVVMPERVCDQKSLLVIVVCTAPGNFEERNAIRETWGSERYVLGNNVSLYFLIGETGNYSVQNDVLLESKQYDDIIQERFVDSYNNLTLKSIAMLKIATSYCINTTKYLLKIDDDMFLNLPLLIEMLLRKNTNESVLLGKLICRAKPIKDTSSKWYSPRYMYKEQIYPNYLSGTSYLMSLDVAEKLFTAALSTPIFHLEDVYLTGMCARKAQVRPCSHPLFTYSRQRNEPCEFRNLITIHHFTPEQLRETFRALKDPHLPKRCEKYKPTFNSHSWLLGNILKPGRVHRKNRHQR
ncbi:beta-1,3-galactosyltransferase 1 isoform X2 [Anoplophora glabripennis]|uniref:beta-1,3-galactosyltransferase 1 isoform X2 n=1 Tax=Anoplophora glabripennis TaxID=217634 RepID=UPI0008751D1E|nr:beta-1,3-galactosyltransferase 1 isoform X2 [Anoplophora glabripennis]